MENQHEFINCYYEINNINKNNEINNIMSINCFASIG